MTVLETLQRALADRYTFEREIGAGGMATVYLARDLKHGRNVAVKVLKPELGAVLGVERFLSEIRVTANLQHPNLLPLFDSGEANGLLFYVMPFVQGESLRARLDREKQLPIEDAVRIAVAVAGALSYAHDHDVIHRDLKPENILIQAGQPVIADFGIALAVSNAGGARVTQTGISLGTPQYMSPEQATGDREINARSDIYSLGAVTYEMLAGEPPHSGTSAQAIIAKLMTSEPRPLTYMRPSVPLNVAFAVEKALAKLPADRFVSADDFAHALTNPSFTLSTRSGIAAELAGGHAAAKRWRRVSVAAGAVVALLLTAALWGWLRTQPPRPVLRYTLTLDSTQSLTGLYQRLALSPDGSTVVFAGGPEPNQRLYVRRRSQFTASPLAGTEGALSPFFSPDGKQIAYSTNVFDLRIVPVTGGPSVTIADSIVNRDRGSWSSDGFIYAGDRYFTGIYRIRPVAGAVPERVTHPDTAAHEESHVSPAALPNGKGLLFEVGYPGRRSSAIAVADLSTNRHRVLFVGTNPMYSPSGHIIYDSSDGILMAVSFDQNKMRITGEPFPVIEGPTGELLGAMDLAVSTSGTLMYTMRNARSNSELVWVSREGKAQVVDSAWHGLFGFPSISPDGGRLAVGLNAGLGWSVWIKQLDRGPALKLTSGPNSNYPAWTPDGKSVSYYTNVIDPNFGLWIKPADGSALGVHLANTGRAAETLWSPDGRWLILRTSVAESGKGDVLAIRRGLGVDTTHLSLATTNSSELAPALSPDGRWLAYSSNETGRDEIYVVPFPDAAAAKWPVSTQGGTEPAWAHNGHELFYRDGSGRMTAVDVKLAPTFSVGTSKILFPTHGYVGVNLHRQYDVSRDDRRFLMIRLKGSTAADNTIMVVDNWFEELKARSRK